MKQEPEKEVLEHNSSNALTSGKKNIEFAALKEWVYIFSISLALIFLMSPEAFMYGPKKVQTAFFFPYAQILVGLFFLLYVVVQLLSLFKLRDFKFLKRKSPLLSWPLLFNLILSIGFTMSLLNDMVRNLASSTDLKYFFTALKYLLWYVLIMASPLFWILVFLEYVVMGGIKLLKKILPS